MPPASCCVHQCCSQQRSRQTPRCSHHFCCGALGTQVQRQRQRHHTGGQHSGVRSWPGCGTAQARADFPLREQLLACHPPTTHPYLKMHLCSQQLLVELRVLQDVVAMANALGLQEVNCLESMGKTRTASKPPTSPACPEVPAPPRVQPAPLSQPQGGPSLSHRGQISAWVPSVCTAMNTERTRAPLSPVQGMHLPSPAPLPAPRRELLVPP